jgi:hypothetical protein
VDASSRLDLCTMVRLQVAEISLFIFALSWLSLSFHCIGGGSVGPMALLSSFLPTSST